MRPHRADARVDGTVIRAFRTEDADAFRALNEEGMGRGVRIAPHDRRVLNFPRETIIDAGGAILIAANQGRPVGCVALVPHSRSDAFAIAQLAVHHAIRRQGLGRRLVRAALDEARARGAHCAYLESHPEWRPVLALCEAEGFAPEDPQDDDAWAASAITPRHVRLVRPCH